MRSSAVKAFDKGGPEVGEGFVEDVQEVHLYL